MGLITRVAGRPQLYKASQRLGALSGRRHLTNNGFFRVSEEVREALHSKKPVVALETTIYTHGFPYPENVALASLLESVVRTNGGVPATIGILDGVARVGMDPEELIKLTASAGQATTLKLSRRDLSYVGGLRLTGKLFNGGTTIASTMLLAQLAGIKIFGTGGLGGVHRGAESSMDISADLTELGRTPVTIVASGCKSFLDIPRTLEYLETEGVGVGTFADGRTGKVDFPAFWARDSGVKSPNTIADEKEGAAIIYAQHALQIQSGLLFANPVPVEAAIPKEEMDVIITEALKHADAQGARGKDNTPFVLAKIKELSKGKSIPANRALIESNVRRATIMARELAILETTQAEAQGTSSYFTPTSSASTPVICANEHKLQHGTIAPSPSPSEPESPSQVHGKYEIIIAGALAVDFSCDYAPLSTSKSQIDPLPHTSNPAAISQSLGGVGHNIAKAAHLLGASVQFYSAVGDDFSGRAALAQLQDEGMSFVAQPRSSPARTAQYVAVNNANKDLAIAMADMSILENVSEAEIETYANTTFANSAPSIFVADGNWSSNTLSHWLRLARQYNTTTIFEPVSTAKALRIFPSEDPAAKITQDNIFPSPLVDIITPNNHELIALHNHAHASGFFDSPAWFSVIDALSIPSSGLRVPLTYTTTSDLVDQGIPQQAIKLLPFFPTILTKLGPLGVLLVKILRADAKELYDDSERQYVLARNMQGTMGIGGLYVRLFPPERILSPEEVVSVNGIGDTFCGAVAVGLSRGVEVQNVIPLAQRAASLSLRSKDSVSKELSGLQENFRQLR